ncbi:MAG: PAS domain S-box protein [Deltaproteobacteria bacterium]|nr:PAS domain S-box protein [Deltaproteobacteria bacterium]
MNKKRTYEELEQRIKELEKESFERKRAEEDLNLQKRRLESLIEYSSLAIVTLDEGHNIVSCNRDFEELFYFKESDMIGRNVDELIAGQEYIEDAIAYTKQTLSGQAIRGSGKRQRKDGTSIDVEFIGVPVVIDEKVIGAYGIYQDISERKQIEKALQQSEKKYSTLVEESFDGIFIQKGTKIIFANQRLQKMLGYEENELLGMDHWLIYHPEYQELTKERAKARMRGENVTPQYEVKLQRKDGSWFYGEIGARMINLDGEPGAQVWVKDIMKQTQAQEAIQQSEKRFRELFDSVSDLIYTQDLQGHFLSANRALIHIFGYELEEFIGRQTTDFMKPELRPYFGSEYLEPIREHGYHEGITAYFTKDGRKIYIEYRSTLVQSEDGGSYISGTGRDVTEKVLAERQIKKLQKQMLQTQKMEAIGVLAGGIAHDFNNLLMGIQGRTSLMMMDTESSHPHFEHLKGIEDYVKSAADLTKQLLGFARGGKYEVKPTDINEMIKKSSSMFGRTKKEIKVHRKYQKDVWTVKADQGQIEQVLMNLYVNAWQAMSNGGDLYVQTENVTLDDDYVKPFEIKPGKYVKISVTDTGLGMDEATRQRIFDPFFTTKEMGRGSGLGLASAYGIIKNHGGFINVYSEKGEGTTFNIYLPASESEVRDQKSVVSDGVKHGDETVLLVDDEDMIIDVGEQLLEKMGYTVLIARSGKEATEIYEEKKDQIDMVIVDMIMPDMSGGDTFDRLREINPDVKVLLSSGYSITGQATEILERGCDGFIHKPFNMKQLSRKLRDILDKD